MNLYRVVEKRRITAVLRSGSSLLIVGEAGIGKSMLGEAVAQELKDEGYSVALIQPASTKQLLTRIAEQLGVETQDLEGKNLSTVGLRHAIAQFLQANTAFLVCDSAHHYTPEFRRFLEILHEQNQPLLLLATAPPAKDIFLKLPRLELKPMTDIQIRDIMAAHALEVGLSISTAQLAGLQQRCGGNPMLAKRVIEEEYLGLEDTAPDHTQWIDGTPYLIAALMVFGIVRVVGIGLNSTSMYLIGGILTVCVGILRLIFYSLPKKSARLG
ncbi:ATP-binding protein [Kovacikia minuta CCNUW1]|uniref:ATP-binding protein n=1 Tax=Kovacikia minuta TaxID=2931930 RepID=UPI001CCCE044|nr:ATP-binding protein [Kovacikia minuta]UBF27497.1 ATP-binding protein [Kovacikia minuta CCNUW1]